MKPPVAGPTAALAGTPAGIQAQGVWAGRRQLFVRFAAEAETATMYTADALANEINRAATRSAFHSVSIGGRDPLANCEYLMAVFEKTPRELPMMVDSDGQRPEQAADLQKLVRLFQVTLDGMMLGSDPHMQCAMESLKRASGAGMETGFVIISDERVTDSSLLRAVELARAATEKVQIVIHPGPGVPVDRDRRWTTVIEAASRVHPDVRVALRLPPPTGMR